MNLDTSSICRKKEKSVKSYNIGVLVSEKYLGEYASFYWKMYQSVATRAVQKECFTMLEVVSLEDEAESKLPKIDATLSYA